jgi:hypothetical protein
MAVCCVRCHVISAIVAKHYYIKGIYKPLCYVAHMIFGCSFLFISMDNTPNLTDMVKHGLIRLVNDELSLFFKQLLN